MTTGFGFCPNCGTRRTAPEQKFCPGCGATLSVVAPLASLADEAADEAAADGAAADEALPSPPPVPEPLGAATTAPPLWVAPPAPPSAQAVPPAPSYPPAYPGGSPPAYMGSPTLAGPGAPAATGRGHKTLRNVLMVLGILVVAAVVAVSWLGVVQVPVLSQAFGMDRARDLGVKADPAAFQAFANQYGISRPSAPGDYTLSSTHHWSGTVQVDGTLSEAALAGRPEFQNANSHVNQIQFRIHDGYAEVAAFVNSVPGYPFSGPVYGRFSVSVTSPTTVAIDIAQLDFGRIGVPGNVASQVQSTLNDYLNEKISEAGVRIDSLELREGGIYFQGTWPQTITADPPNPNDVP